MRDGASGTPSIIQGTVTGIFACAQHPWQAAVELFSRALLPRLQG
jgi:hypothetical protein